PAIFNALYLRTQIDIHVYVLAHDGAFLPTSLSVTPLVPFAGPPPLANVSTYPAGASAPSSINGPFFAAE
ncbi:hypothetical protein K488DRAFT_65258, partial [Vararia minispora EC-137]